MYSLRNEDMLRVLGVYRPQDETDNLRTEIMAYYLKITTTNFGLAMWDAVQTIGVVGNSMAAEIDDEYLLSVEHMDEYALTKDFHQRSLNMLKIAVHLKMKRRKRELLR